MFQGVGRLDGGGHGGEVGVARLDRVADQLLLFGRTDFHDANQRQGRLAFAQVVANVLAQRGGVAAVVEHVIDQLERGAHVAAIRGRCGLLLGGGARQHRADLGGGLEQLGGLVAHDLQVALLGHVWIVHVQELQHFALGDHRGGFGQDAHDAHRVGLDHHLERTRIQIVAHQHAGRVAEYGVGGFAAAAQVRFVHDVVVQQRGRMDEFHHGGQKLVMRAFVPQGARHHQHHGRAHALAAGPNDVVADRADQDHIGIQPLADNRVDGFHIVSNGGNERGEIQDVSDKCEASRVTALTAGPASGRRGIRPRIIRGVRGKSGHARHARQGPPPRALSRSDPLAGSAPVGQQAARRQIGVEGAHAESPGRDRAGRLHLVDQRAQALRGDDDAVARQMGKARAGALAVLGR